MIHINKIEDCCGCNACSDICKQGAITYSFDQEGFCYPTIDPEKCNDCGACEKVCPILNIKDLKKNEFDLPQCHAMIHKNLEIRFDSSSGGAFSALAELIYKQGGYVGGAIWTSDWMVEHFISSNRDDLEKLRSSKYLQSNAQGFYKAERQLLLQGEKVLVCGTPCQMAALRAFLRKPYDNLIIVDFICGGINSPKVWRKYLKYQEEKFGAKVIYIKTRNTELGWRKVATKIVFNNGKTFYDPVDKCTFMRGFIETKAYCRPSCYQCKFKGLPRISDITIADFWGAEKFVSKEFDNDLGTSVAMVNNSKGKSFYEQITSSILDKNISLCTILKTNSALTKIIVNQLTNRKEFFNDLDKMSFGELAKKYIKSSYRPKFKSLIKRYTLNFVHFTKDVACASQFSVRTWLKNIRYNFFFLPIKTNIFKSRGYIVFSKHCTSDIHKDSTIILNGPFYTENIQHKNSHLKSKIIVEKGAKIVIDSSFSLPKGSTVKVLEGAIFHIIGKGFINDDSIILNGDFIEICDGIINDRDLASFNNAEPKKASLNQKDYTSYIKDQHIWLCDNCCLLQGVTIGDAPIYGIHTLFLKSSSTPISLVACNPKKLLSDY